MTIFNHPPPNFLIFWSKVDTIKRLTGFPVKSTFIDVKAPSTWELILLNQIRHLLIVDSSAEQIPTLPSSTDSITKDEKCLNG